MSRVAIGGGMVELDGDLPGILQDLETQLAVLTPLIRAGTNPTRPVVGLSWTVQELNAHLTATAVNYAAMAAGESIIPQPVSERRAVIDQGVAQHHDQSPDEQARAIEAGTARLIDALRTRTPDDRCPFYGMEVEPWLIAGIYLNEFVVHGVDLARTHGKPVEVPDAAAYRSLVSSSALIPLVLTDWARAHNMVLGYAARGHAPILVTLDHGTVTIAHHTDLKVDAWFGGSAKDLLLVAYHRVSNLRALKTLRLRGRRPYLALLADRAFQPA